MRPKLSHLLIINALKRKFAIETSPSFCISAISINLVSL